jgi:hypothetical protein
MDKVGAAVLAGGFDQVDGLIASLDSEQLGDLLVGLSMRAKVDTLVAGRVAYEIRTRTPDGEWGRQVRALAAECEVSDRTIHRWMSAYQEATGLELTPAQENARAQQAFRQQAEGLDEEPASWDDWDEGEETSSAGFDYGETGGESRQALRDLVGEPWAERDSVTPSTTYVNPPESEKAAPRQVIPPDETWLAFTESQVVDEHPALGPSGAAAKAALAKWNVMTLDEPLELLDQLEMIHGGDGVPDELASALIEADERKPIKGEIVDKPKAKRAKASGPSVKSPEGLMMAVRELHQKIVVTKNEQGARAVATEFGPHVSDLQALVQVAQGCLNKVRSAVDEAKRTAPEPATEEF